MSYNTGTGDVKYAVSVRGIRNREEGFFVQARFVFFGSSDDRMIRSTARQIVVKITIKSGFF